jgi:hypothetical protein
MSEATGPVPVDLRVEFQSDWHIGSGLEQPGATDRVVQQGNRF